MTTPLPSPAAEACRTAKVTTDPHYPQLAVDERWTTLLVEPVPTVDNPAPSVDNDRRPGAPSLGTNGGQMGDGSATRWRYIRVTRRPVDDRAGRAHRVHTPATPADLHGCRSSTVCTGPTTVTRFNELLSLNPKRCGHPHPGDRP